MSDSQHNEVKENTKDDHQNKPETSSRFYEEVQNLTASGGNPKAGVGTADAGPAKETLPKLTITNDKRPPEDQPSNRQSDSHPPTDKAPTKTPPIDKFPPLEVPPSKYPPDKMPPIDLSKFPPIKIPPIDLSKFPPDKSPSTIPWEGGDASIFVNPMTEEKLDEQGKKIAEKLMNGKGKFGDEKDAEELKKLFMEAEKSGQLKELIARINSELAKNHSDLTLTFTEKHTQDKNWPELSPFDSWNHYDIQLKADSGETLDKMDFDGKVTHHRGHYR